MRSAYLAVGDKLSPVGRRASLMGELRAWSADFNFWTLLLSGQDAVLVSHGMAPVACSSDVDSQTSPCTTGLMKGSMESCAVVEYSSARS